MCECFCSERSSSSLDHTSNSLFLHISGHSPFFSNKARRIQNPLVKARRMVCSHASWEVGVGRRLIMAGLGDEKITFWVRFYPNGVLDASRHRSPHGLSGARFEEACLFRGLSHSCVFERLRGRLPTRRWMRTRVTGSPSGDRYSSFIVATSQVSEDPEQTADVAAGRELRLTHGWIAEAPAISGAERNVSDCTTGNDGPRCRTWRDPIPPTPIPSG